MAKLCLNGWQRLWVLLSLIYLIFIMIICLFSAGDSNQIYYTKSYWSKEMLQVVRDDLAPKGATKAYIDSLPSKEFAEFKARVKRWGSYKRAIENAKNEADLDKVINDSESYLRQNPKYADQLIEIRKKYEVKLKDIESSIVNTYYICFAFWFVPVMIMYCFGWCIGWVYRGFKAN